MTRGYTATCFIVCLSLLMIVQLRFKIFIMPTSELNSLHGAAAVMDAPNAANEAKAQEGVTSSKSALISPNVLMIGSQKAGTTTVAHCCCRHLQPVVDKNLTMSLVTIKRKSTSLMIEWFECGKEFYARRFTTRLTL